MAGGQRVRKARAAMAGPDETATAEAARAASEAAHALDAVCRAARHYRLYPPGHPGSAAAVSAAAEAAAGLTKDHEAVIFAAVGERLLVNGTEVPADAATARLATELGGRHIRAVRLSAGLDAAEAEALLQVLSMDVQQVERRGGPAALVQERGLAHLEIEEVSYERFVLESEAARDAAPEDVFLQALQSDPTTVAEMDVTSLVGMLEAPQQLANKLVSWLTARGGSGGYGGEGGSGVGPGVGDGIGTGGEVPLIIGGREVDPGNRAGAILGLALQRLGEAVRERSPEEWAATRRKLTEVFRSLSVGLRRRILQADVVPADVSFDVLQSVGVSLDVDEAIELLGADAEEAIEDPSVTIERLLRRVAPTQDRLQRIAPAARERLKELGLPDEASASVVGRLLDALAESRGSLAGGRRLGSFRTDDATREKRRAEGEDLFALLDEAAMWRARVSVCLEVLESIRDAEAYLTVLDAIESTLARIHRDDHKGNGIALRVVSALRARQQSPDLPQRCRERTAKTLAKLESTGGVESVRAAIATASGAERTQLIALLADLGARGRAALCEMLRDRSHASDLPVILATLARLERSGAPQTQAEHTDEESDAGASEAPDEASTRQEHTEQLDLRSLLLDPEWKNAPAAVEYLAEHSGTFATKYLSIALAQGYFALRVAVMQALTAHSSSEVLDLLIFALDNSEPGIQEMAAAALGQIRDPRVAVALMKVAEPKGLLDKRTRLRAVAMIALGSLGCTAAFDLLARTLRHRPLLRREVGAELSAAAAIALGRLGTERAQAALERGLSDRRPAVRAACHKALSEAAARGA